MEFINTLLKSFRTSYYANVEEITLLICNQMHVGVSELTVLKYLYAHPDYPCLLSVSETLNKLGINTYAYKIKDIKELSTYESSFLIQIEEEGETFFSLVYNMNEKEIVWYNPTKHKKEKIPLDSFMGLFTGYILLYEVSEKYEEAEYHIQRKYEKRQHFIFGVLFASVISYCLICSFAFILNSSSDYVLYNTFIALLLCCGSTIALLTTFFEMDNSNQVITQLCKKTNKTNCSKVLSSKGSKIYGVPWSVIGASYFIGIYINLSQNNFDHKTLQSIAIIHLFTLPYVIYSISYQKMVVKQWCKLCLYVQLVIIFLACLFWKLQLYTSFSIVLFNHIISVLMTVLLTFYTLYFFTNYIIESKLRHISNHIVMNMKYDYNIFKGLTLKQTKINTLNDNYGIILGNHNGSIHITFVCSPYCSYCAEAFPQLLTTLKNTKIKLHIVFTTNPLSTEYAEGPINMFLSLYKNGKDMQSILTDWYGRYKMKMSTFIKQYNTVDSSNDQNLENATEMYKFCQRVKIKGTPTIYINGYILPKLYNANNLSILLTSKT